uniref:Uncharacterized protein n=1 Tax=Panagrolaimus davidi TaxID=227884 RepID=A0A914R2L5_9BILA
MSNKSQHVFIRPSLSVNQRDEFELQRKQVRYLNEAAKKKLYCIYAGHISYKSVADSNGRSTKQKTVEEYDLQSLLKEYDPNQMPLNARESNQANGTASLNDENFSMS